MTDEEKKAQEAKEKAEAQAAAAAKAKEGTTDDVAALKAQLDKEKAERQAANAEAQKHRKRLREIEDERKKADEAALAEQGKHKELAEARAKEIEATRKELEQLRSEKAQRDEQEAAARAQKAAQVAADFAQLPEEVRKAIPSDADTKQQEIAIAAFRAGSGQKVAPTTPIAPKPAGGGASGGEPTKDDFARAYHPSTSAEEKARLQKKIADYQQSLR